MSEAVQIEHWDPERDGELSEAAMREKLRAKGFEVSTYHYPPGTYFPEHTHSVDKIDGVLRGRFRLTMFGQSLVLEPGDCLYVPQGAPHSAEVVGNETVVSLDAIRRD